MRPHNPFTLVAPVKDSRIEWLRKNSPSFKDLYDKTQKVQKEQDDNRQMYGNPTVVS
jgi:hypothetical protein